MDRTGTEHLPNSKISRRTTEVQDSKIWTSPGGVLGELVQSSVARARELRPSAAAIRSRARAMSAPPAFGEALKGENVAVIAEVKRASPSKGVIRPDLDISAQCSAYERGGAAAISVLTEPSRFGGSLEDLAAARAACGRPILRKDFIVDEIQIAEARAAGASAVLLIARALAPAKLAELLAATTENGLSALVEIRNHAELETALRIGAAIIGVNNRNLETLEMDDRAQSLLPHIPRACTAVAESGYRTRADVMRAADAGADAVLIGSELSGSLAPQALLAELVSATRNVDARPN